MTAKNTILSVFIHLMRGEHDDHLHWPLECSVGVELINWREDKGHLLKRINGYAFSLVTDSDMDDLGWGMYQFVSHASLAYDPAYQH